VEILDTAKMFKTFSFQLKEKKTDQQQPLPLRHHPPGSDIFLEGRHEINSTNNSK